MKKLFLILLAISLSNCKNELPKKDIAQIKKSNKKTTDSLNLEFINYKIDTLSGCHQIVSNNSEDLANNRAFYISNLTDFAIIKINGTKLYLQKDTINSIRISDMIYKEIYISKNYKTILDMQIYNNSEEFYRFKGTLQIISNKSNVKLKIKGEGGC